MSQLRILHISSHQHYHDSNNLTQNNYENLQYCINRRWHFNALQQ